MKCHAVNLIGIFQNNRPDPAEPVEIIPLPAPKFFWTFVEKSESSTQIIQRQFAMGQSDAMKV